MNKIHLSGRLTNDPEIRYMASADNRPVASFSLAVTRTKEVTDFFRIKAFDKRAEFAEKYLRKGTKIILSGKIQQESFKTRDGKQVDTYSVIADEMEFAESKKADKEETKEAEWNPADEELPFKL